MTNKQAAVPPDPQINLDQLEKIIVYYPNRDIFEKIASEAIQAAADREAKTKDFMDLRSTCSYLDISFNTLKKFITQDDLPVIKLGAKQFISKESLKTWLHAHET